MKTTLKGICVFVFAAILCGQILADPTIIQDNYIGGTASQSSYANQDRIGDGFETYSMSVELAGNLLSIGIKSDYFQNIGKLGTQFGDVFISTDGWNPYGDAAYLEDTMNNGESWEYALDFDDNLAGSGSVSLFRINADNIITSDDFHGGSQYGYRRYQEVQVDTTGLEALATGSWSTSGKDLTLSIDTEGVFNTVTDFGFHWCQTCGNDVIEGSMSSPVPEPGITALIGLGLMGLVCARKRMGTSKN